MIKRIKLFKPVSSDIILERAGKSLSLICDRCGGSISSGEKGLSKWRYDDDSDQVLCPICVSELIEFVTDSEIGKIVSFMEGATWALEEFYYDEVIGTTPPPHVNRAIEAKRREMIEKLKRRIFKKFGFGIDKLVRSCGGYQPSNGHLDSSDPPKGGSGIKQKGGLK